MTTFVLQYSKNSLNSLVIYFFIYLVFRNSSTGFLKDVTKLFFGVWALARPNIDSFPLCNNREAKIINGPKYSLETYWTRFPKKFFIVGTFIA